MRVGPRSIIVCGRVSLRGREREHNDHADQICECKYAAAHPVEQGGDVSTENLAVRPAHVAPNEHHFPAQEAQRSLTP